MKNTLLLLTLLFTSLSTSASYLKECGTGHVLAGDALGGWVAVSTNISSSTSDASTSKLSTPELCGKSLWSAAKFIDTNYPMIEQDTAMGNGEHLTAMLDIMECNNASRPSIVQAIRQDFSQIVTTTNYANLPHEKKVESYFNIMSTQVTKNAGQCTAV